MVPRSQRMICACTRATRKAYYRHSLRHGVPGPERRAWKQLGGAGMRYAVLCYRSCRSQGGFPPIAAVAGLPIRTAGVDPTEPFGPASGNGWSYQ